MEDSLGQIAKPPLRDPLYGRNGLLAGMDDELSGGGDFSPARGESPLRPWEKGSPDLDRQQGPPAR